MEVCCFWQLQTFGPTMLSVGLGTNLVNNSWPRNVYASYSHNFVNVWNLHELEGISLVLGWFPLCLVKCSGCWLKFHCCVWNSLVYRVLLSCEGSLHCDMVCKLVFVWLSMSSENFSRITLMQEEIPWCWGSFLEGHGREYVLTPALCHCFNLAALRGSRW